jgi:hypothetical protein
MLPNYASKDVRVLTCRLPPRVAILEHAAQRNAKISMHVIKICIMIKISIMECQNQHVPLSSGHENNIAEGPSF